MNALFTRISTISVILFVCVCNALEVRADKNEEYFLLEAKLSKKTMRSSALQQTVSPLPVDVNDEMTFGFNKLAVRSLMNVNNETMWPVYPEYTTGVQKGSVLVDGPRSETYFAQLTALFRKYIKCIFLE